MGEIRLEIAVINGYLVIVDYVNCMKRDIIIKHCARYAWLR